MISDQISNLIDQAKQHKSGESRNSMISRLKDARAHAFVMERDEFMGSSDTSSRLKSVASVDSIECICPAPGVISSSCLARVHKLS